MRRPEDLAAGLVVGAVAGLVASFVMERFQEAWIALRPRENKSTGPTVEPSTVVAADAVAKAVVGKPVAPKKRAAAGNLVHYASGAVMGAAYGLGVTVAPGLATGAGAAYGAALWLVVDEGLVSLFRLGPPPEESKASEHGYALVSHLVFGLALEGSRRLLGGPSVARQSS